MKRIAVVGGGIAGIACADALAARADVTLFEASARLGGHTDTHWIDVGGTQVAIDSGFIVFNRRNYPGFAAWLDRLGVDSHETDMSFSVTNPARDLEYGTDRVGTLFVQPANALRPRFLRMLTDIARFYRDARTLSEDEARMDLATFVAARGYGAGFCEDHLIPMCGALWSLPLARVQDCTIGHVVAFMNNHGMLGLRDRPVWRVVSGGSSRYVDAFVRRFRGRLRTGAAVRAVRRGPEAVEVQVDGARLVFDAVVLACHPDQALALLTAPTAAEFATLGAIRYQPNRVVVHTDARLMPSRRAAWSSWNAWVDADPAAPCTVTYWMNRLQRVRTPRPVFVSLNPGARVDPATVLATRDYAHPHFDAAAVTAQALLEDLQGVGGVYYAGSWFGWGFHEDGFTAGRAAAACVLEDRERSRAA